MRTYIHKLKLEIYFIVKIVELKKENEAVNVAILVVRINAAPTV